MHHDLRLTDVSRPAAAGGCGCGGACACGGHAAHADASAAPAQRFAVTGMTCGHCVSSVQEEVGALDGVQAVEVALVPGGASTVTVRADRALTADEVRAAVEDAGYALQRS